MKKLLLTLVMALCGLTASANTPVSAADKTNKADTLLVTTTPQMHCANCEKKVKTNIRFVKGVKSIETSVPEQTVKIVYDPSKSKYSDFEAAFKKIGYEIKPTKQPKK